MGVILIATAAMAAGCLRKETTHTLYLSPEGRLSWMALEKDVRSDEADPARRVTEEHSYITAAAEGIHPLGRGLAALDPRWLGTRVIRNERPFVVITEAEFSSLEFAARRLLMQLDVEGDVLVGYDGPATKLVVRVNAVPAVERDDPGAGPQGPVTELVDDLDRYRIVLTNGRFIAATGFTLSDDKAIALPVKPTWDNIIANGGILEMSLSWTR